MAIAVLCDTNRCIGCRGCQVACKQWQENDEFIPLEENGVPSKNRGRYENPPQLSARTWTKIRFTELEHDGKFHWVFTKLQCMHCEHPACVAACPVGALRKTAEGPVVYDDTRCFGCRYCMVACPFGIPAFEWDRPLPWVRKCTFCADRLGAGLEPACVKTCPTDALKLGERGELLALARELIAQYPQHYVNHIYGEKEAGGTSWLYLSPVPFEKLGLPTLGAEPVTLNAERAIGAVLPVLFGVAATMAGVYWLVKRRDRMGQERDGEKGKEEVQK
ncbi:MAG TPA: 4Fe-4S dicluster domain-containing protein [Dehalococcoidales bacterium]|nr:4Fe-4S dicluster domain-containing protein [Dehalococcoidales bacterium]